MSIQFTPLWETMRRQNLTTYRLIQMGFSKGTLHRLNTISRSAPTQSIHCSSSCDASRTILWWIPNSEVPSCISSESQT